MPISHVDSTLQNSFPYPPTPRLLAHKTLIHVLIQHDTGELRGEAAKGMHCKADTQTRTAIATRGAEMGEVGTGEIDMSGWNAP